MKVLIFVLNDVNNDPRVNKQIYSYKNHNFQVICLGIKTGLLKTDIQIKSSIKYYFFKHIIYKSFILKFFLYPIRNLMLFIRLYKTTKMEKPTFIHSNDLNAAIYTVFLKLFFKIKIIYDSHEIFIENNNLIGKPLKKFFLRILESFVIRYSSIMLCVSESAKLFFIRNYKPKKIIVLKNGVLNDDLKTPKHQINSENINVLIQGKYYTGRGYDIFIKAAILAKNSQLNQIRWYLRGFGPLENELLLLKKNNNLENVYFLPPVKINEIVSNASKFDIGVVITEPICINFNLSLSNKIFEYAAAGLPIIASANPEHLILYDIYDFGIILKDNSPSSLLDSVLKISENKEKLKKYSENSYKMASNLSWDNEFLKLMELLYEI